MEFDGTLSNNGEYVDAQVADGKVELQKWWDASEKAESGVDDVISVSYTKIEVIYEYVSDSSSGVKGDVNSDGEFNVADIVMLQNYIIRSESITDKDAGDLCEGGVIDTFDVAAMRKMLIS